MDYIVLLLLLLFALIVIAGVSLIKSGVEDVLYEPEPNTCMECGDITTNFALCFDCQSSTDSYYRQREYNLPRITKED